MWTERASAARYEPIADPAVAQKRRAQPRFRRRRDRRPVAPKSTRGSYHRRATRNSGEKCHHETVAIALRRGLRAVLCPAPETLPTGVEEGAIGEGTEP